MKHSIFFTTIAAGLLTLASSPADAQMLHSTYFLDNYTYNYRINPSLLAEKSFLSVGLGTINTELSSDLGLTSFIFPNEDGTGLVTALHPSVTADQFLGGLKDINSFRFGLSYDLFSLGTRTDNGMFTIEAGIVNDLSLDLPKGLFSFIKQGSSETAYDFSGFGLSNRTVMEIAVGKASVSENGKFTLGFRVKGLLGGLSVVSSLEKALLTCNGDLVSAEVIASGNMSCKMLDTGDDPSTPDFSNVQFDPAAFSPVGFGAAVDLGLTWKPAEFVSITAGVSDLGAIWWQNQYYARTEGNVSFDGFEEIDLTSGASSVSEQLETLTDDLSKIADLKYGASDGIEVEMRPVTLNAGLRLGIPGTKLVSVGGLATYRFSSSGNVYELRAGATLTPFKWLSATANYGLTSYGNTCGLAAAVSVLGLNFHLAADAYAGPIVKFSLNGLDNLMMPINPFRYRLSTGVTLQFGKRRR